MYTPHHPAEVSLPLDQAYYCDGFDPHGNRRLPDDAPAARFTQRLCELIENGYDLYKSKNELQVGVQ